MNYVLLDTNIIIDMVVDRRNQIGNRFLNKFLKMLNFGEIKLIVPEIIKTETFRHLDTEIKNVGKQIENALDDIKKLYGISTLEIEGLDLSVYKKNARKELSDALTIFDSRKDAFRADIFKSIGLIFEHENCIQIEDISLMDKVIKRKIYKKAPFHKVEKESYGDGIIAETLININQFITISENDAIYFVTGNYKDFSDSNKKCELHSNILEDLEKNNIKDVVKYVDSFSKLIGKELKDSIKNAELIEEIEAWEREMAEQYYAEMADVERESVGLSSLSSFEYNVDEILQTSEFGSALSELDGEISAIKNSIEDLMLFYEDGFEDLLSNVSSSLTNKFLAKLTEVCSEIDETTLAGLLSLQEWVKEKYIELSEYNVGDSFECIEYGKAYNIYSVEQEEYTLEIDEKYLSPSTGEKDEIDIRLYGEYEEQIRYAHVDISYGSVTFDDDGGIADAFEEGVYIEDYGIIDKLKELLNEWRSFIVQEEKIKDRIEDVFEEFSRYEDND